jgi:hypothetical protein
MQNLRLAEHPQWHQHPHATGHHTIRSMTLQAQPPHILIGTSRTSPPPHHSPILTYQKLPLSKIRPRRAIFPPCIFRNFYPFSNCISFCEHKILLGTTLVLLQNCVIHFYRKNFLCHSCKLKNLHLHSY